jgi:NADP-dependent aldehyde dehydrogenase
MLMDRLHAGHEEVLETLTGRPAVRVLVRGVSSGEDDTVAPTLLATDVAGLMADQEAILTECFGPTSILVEYDDLDEAVRAARVMGGSLTATVHAEAEETQAVAPLLRELRIVWNGWPTGVAVSWGQHHGGPYPATTAPSHTSVGMMAVRRFQRPVSYQDTPQSLLPSELRDANPTGIVRRVDGRLTSDAVARR